MTKQQAVDFVAKFYDVSEADARAYYMDEVRAMMSLAAKLKLPHQTGTDNPIDFPGGNGA